MLGFFIGTMVRDDEAQRARYSDLTGAILTVHGKQHKTRTVDISPRPAAAIREWGKHSESEILVRTAAASRTDTCSATCKTLPSRSRYSRCAGLAMIVAPVLQGLQCVTRSHNGNSGTKAGASCGLSTGGTPSSSHATGCLSQN